MESGDTLETAELYGTILNTNVNLFGRDSKDMTSNGEPSER